MKLAAFEVFTPTSFPLHTYVERPQVDNERKLSPWLEVNTLVASLSGPSKAGKTVLVQRVVGESALITVSGASVRTADQLWDRVLDWIGEPHTTSATATTIDTRSQSIEGVTSAGFPGVVSFQGKGGKSTGASMSDNLTATSSRRGLPQVVYEIANSEYTILVDDFHYIPADVQTEVAQQIKDAASRGVRICVASVPHRADQVVRALPELRGRVIAIDLDYWSSKDLLSIPVLGCEKLGLTVDKASLEVFATEAAGSPQLMQAICLQMCLNRGVTKTIDPTQELKFDDTERRLILNATSSMTDFRSLVRSLVAGPRKRGMERRIYPFKDGGRGEVYLAIMRAIASDPPRLEFDYEELTSRVRRVCASDAPPGSSILGSCFHLGEIAKGYPAPSGPALSWDNEDNVLTIPDPYLLFYLRWSGHLESEAQVVVSS